MSTAIVTKIQGRPTYKTWPRNDPFSQYSLTEWQSNGCSFVGRADNINASPGTGVFEINDKLGTSTVFRQPAGQNPIQADSNPWYCGGKTTLYMNETPGSANQQYLTATASILPTTALGAFCFVVAFHPLSSTVDLMGQQGGTSNLRLQLVTSSGGGTLVRFSVNSTLLQNNDLNTVSLTRKDCVICVGRDSSGKLFNEVLYEGLTDYVSTVGASSASQGVTATPSIGRLSASSFNPTGRWRGFAFVNGNPDVTLASGQTLREEIKRAFGVGIGIL